MTIFPPDIIYKIMEEGWTEFDGFRDRLKEDAPEEYKKAWKKWQKELQKALNFNNMII